MTLPHPIKHPTDRREADFERTAHVDTVTTTVTALEQHSIHRRQKASDKL